MHQPTLSILHDPDRVCLGHNIDIGETGLTPLNFQIRDDDVNTDSAAKPAWRRRREGARLWYVLRVVPQKEFVVGYMLRQAGVMTFIPTEIRRRRRNRYAKGKDEFAFPIIPGTVFAGFEDFPRWFEVLQNSLIVGALGHNGCPWELDPDKFLKWRSRLIDGCLDFDRGMRLIHVQGKGFVRSPLERPHFITKRRQPVVEPTPQELAKIGPGLIGLS